MNKNLYLNIVVTLGLITLITLLVIMINAVDRVFLKNQRILEKIESIEDSLQNTPRQYASAPKSINKAPAFKEAKAFAKIGNVEFFNPKAQTGGRIISSISADTANMNTVINNDSTVSAFTELCSSSLATRNLEKPEIFEPLMAESWTISPDKKVYTIKLRRGILWHDFKDPVSGKVWKNKEVTAHDFKFYIDVIKHPKVNCAPIRVYYRDLEKLELIDDYTFKVHWKNRYFRSEELTLGLSPLPRHLYHAYPGPFDAEKFNEDHQRNRILIGCGPYRFLSWDKDRRVVFTRFQKYFGNKLGIAPPIKYRVFEIIKHPNTRFQALLASKLDRLGLEPVQWVKRTNTPEFAPDGKLKKMKYLSRAYYYMGYNLTRPQFKDKRVRQALTHLVNRKKILKDVYYGLGKIVTGPFYSETPYYDKSIKPYEFSVSHAKKLLAEAGWKDTNSDGILEKDGLKFEFTILQVANNPIQQKMLPIIKEDFAKAGINMKIQTLEWSVLLQRLTEKNFDVCVLGWTLPYESDPYQVWHSSQADKKHSSNHIGFKNKKADQLIEEIRRTFDVKKRIELCHEFHRILHEEQPYTFLFAPYSLLAQSKRYKNVHKFPLGIPTEIMWTPKSEQLKVPGL